MQMSYLVINSTKVSHLSPINYTDWGHFKQFFSNGKMETKKYQNNWDYITQACRNLGHLGWKYFDGETLIPIGKHNGHFVVVNPLGKNIPYKLAQILPQLKKESGHPVYLKHISNDLFFTLVKEPKYINIAQYPWSKDAPKDDDTYPQVLINVKDFIENHRKSSAYRKVRLRLNRFNNLKKKLNLNTEIRELKLENKKEITTVKNFLQEHSKSYAAYHNMVEFPDKDRLSCGYFINNQLEAVLLTGYIDTETVGVYASIFNFQPYPALSEQAFFDFFQFLLNKDIFYLNFGGSEEESLYRFKRKFIPLQEINSNYLVYS